MEMQHMTAQAESFVPTGYAWRIAMLRQIISWSPHGQEGSVSHFLHINLEQLSNNVLP